MKCDKITALIFVGVLAVNSWGAPTGWAEIYEDWYELKETHFIIKYKESKDVSLAHDILRKAEEYYNKIAYQIGYARYQDFWTWDDRVKIILFSDQKSFTDTTGQPEWSAGFASRHSNLFKSRAIVTFKQENNFLEGLLPHEISHLIFRDMIGFDRDIPVWLDEGVAQLPESHQDIMERVMRYLVGQNQHIPFDQFFAMDIQKETDGQKVMIYYAQSYTLVKYMIKSQGQDAFFELCRNLREGKNFEEALRSSFYPSIESLHDLEKKWAVYMTSS